MHNDYDIAVEVWEHMMREAQQHETFRDSCEFIYKFGLRNYLLRLADYCEDPKEEYALRLLSKFYKENERAICKDAPTMQ